MTIEASNAKVIVGDTSPLNIVTVYWFPVNLYSCIQTFTRGHGGRVVTLSPPTSEAGVRSPLRPQVGKLVVACRWLAVYSTEP